MINVTLTLILTNQILFLRNQKLLILTLKSNKENIQAKLFYSFCFQRNLYSNKLFLKYGK